MDVALEICLVPPGGRLARAGEPRSRNSIDCWSVTVSRHPQREELILKKESCTGSLYVYIIPRHTNAFASIAQSFPPRREARPF